MARRRRQRPRLASLGPNRCAALLDTGLKHPGSCPPRRLRRGRRRTGPPPHLLLVESCSRTRSDSHTDSCPDDLVCRGQGNPACPGWSDGACRGYTRGNLRPPWGIPPSRSAQPPSRLACARPGRQFSGARAALTGGSEARSGSAHGDRATDRVGQGHTGGHSPRRRQLHRPPHASDPQMLRLRTREMVPIELRKWS